MPRLFTATRGFGHCISAPRDYPQMYGANNMFHIEGGPIKIWNLGLLVTTATPGTANTAKFRFTPLGGSVTDLSGATSIASAGAQQLFFVDGTKATGLVKTTDVGILAAGQTLNMPIAVSEGIVVLTFSLSTAPASGAILAFMEYEPLATNVKVRVL